MEEHLLLVVQVASRFSSLDDKRRAFARWYVAAQFEAQLVVDGHETDQSIQSGNQPIQ